MTQNPTAPFEYTGGHISLDFVDTVNGRVREKNEELLTDYGRLLQWSQESGTLPKRTVEQLRRLAEEAPEKAESVLRNAIHLREGMYEIFLAVAQGHGISEQAMATLNRAIHQAAGHAEIKGGSRGFSKQWIEPEKYLDAMLWPVAQGAGELLTSEDAQYIRECGADDCGWVFLDKTKNHRRRWCEMKTCGNRAKAKRYYRRQRA
jgi:predicted RNA-binding Zn ribbon-like protein